MCLLRGEKIARLKISPGVDGWDRGMRRKGSWEKLFERDAGLLGGADGEMGGTYSGVAGLVEGAEYDLVLAGHEHYAFVVRRWV